jgi:hypothetical protein
VPATGTLSAIEEALHYWLSQLTFTPSLYIAWPGRAYNPALGSPYLEPDFMPNKTEYGSIGANALRRHRGLYQVLVHDAENVGTNPVAEKADLIIAHFLPPLTVERNGVRVRMGSFDESTPLPWRARSHSEAGWITVPVTIPWWCDVA